ncbi:STAS domain-containing protein [Streptomyces sp. NPDC006975]|uniref:STAS domain-containing protein n=1 Tax=Streptomyces sp. NPDC006975 TaxID=3154310 RepID=UPI003453C185
MTGPARMGTDATVGLHVEALLTSDCAAVYVAGELDLDTAEQLVQTVRTCLTHRPNVVRVDVSELAFCDWYGLKTLLSLHREAQRTGCALKLSGTVRPQLARLLAATGTGHLLTATGAQPTGTARTTGTARPRHCVAAPLAAPGPGPGVPSARPATAPEPAVA